MYSNFVNIIVFISNIIVGLARVRGRRGGGGGAKRIEGMGGNVLSLHSIAFIDDRFAIKIWFLLLTTEFVRRHHSTGNALFAEKSCKPCCEEKPHGNYAAFVHVELQS